MRRYLDNLKDSAKQGDIFLLILCLIVSGFGIVVIASATSAKTGGNFRYVAIQLAAVFLGVLMYIFVSSLDMDFLSEHRGVMVAFNCVLLLLLIPFGTDHGSGNRSWLDFPGLPIDIQPAEVCKITYIIILAKTLSVNQTRVSSLKCVMQLAFHMAFIVVLYIGISKDMGVSLIFVFVFLLMAYVGGVSGWWFLGGIAAVTVAAPYLWEYVIKGYQKNRILVLFDDTIDPAGLNERWQMKQNLKTLSNGGLTGQGLFNGTMTNQGALPARHTDCIFSTIGEQLGMVGAILVLVLLLAIVLRVVYVGLKSPDYMNRLICLGIAAMLLFQILINVGVCLGLLPVIGLALPFISYGGSSIITSFVAMGIVSGIKMRPAPDISAHYIRPY